MPTNQATSCTTTHSFFEGIHCSRCQTILFFCLRHCLHCGDSEGHFLICLWRRQIMLNQPKQMSQESLANDWLPANPTCAPRSLARCLCWPDVVYKQERALCVLWEDGVCWCRCAYCALHWASCPDRARSLGALRLGASGRSWMKRQRLRTTCGHHGAHSLPAGGPSCPCWLTGASPKAVTPLNHPAWGEWKRWGVQFSTLPCATVLKGV